MREYHVAGADGSTLFSASSRWESCQLCADCLDTSLFQSKVFKVIALNAMQAVAWNADDKMKGDESRLGIESTPVISDMTSDLGQAHTAGSAVSGLMCALVIAMSVLIICCIVGSIRMFEKMTMSPLPLTGAARKGDKSSSTTSLSSEQRKKRPPASSRSHSSAVSEPTSARRMQAGKALSAKIKSNGSSVAHPLGTGSANGGQHGTLHSCVSACADHSPSSQEPVRKKTEGCLFTVPVDVMVGVNLTGKGSFTIKDTCSSLVLRGAVPKNSDGSRKVQVFQGEDGTTPCASVEPLPSGPQAILNSFQIRGADNMLLGSLVLQNSGEFVVHCHEQPELVIEGNDADVDLQVSSRDGRPKASVSCKASHPGGMDQVEIHVLPGTDPVLIVACTLAILFLCG
mmetsp:Transcript_47120/g.131297  ORF Transcript_47120/g.131297 Transcript_47120/m.131297 type:complete len:400 (-) Transcript_47120:239-1438(-)